MGKRKNKSEVAQDVTETSEAVQMMATELLDTAINAEVDAEYERVVEAEALDSVDVGDVVAQIEALEGEPVVIEEIIGGEDVMGPEYAEPQQSFDALLTSITQDERIAATVTMAKAVDERMAFESANGNENIQRTLKKVRTQFSSTDAGAVLLACGVSEAFVNRTVHDGKRYNVYALGKLADAINGLSKGAVTNQINNAIMRTLFKARKAGVIFTGETAKMAASDKIRVSDAAIKAILVRHTVSAVTAPTQASSTMQAMETLGLVSRSGSHKNPTFTLTDHPAVAKLEQVLFGDEALAA